MSKDYRDALLRPAPGPDTPAPDLAAIRARRAAITEPPWEVDEYYGDEGGHTTIVQQATDRRSHIAWHLNDEDAAFIAAAPADIDALLAEVERLRAELAREAGMNELARLSQEMGYD